MKSAYVLIGSVLLLANGLGWIFGYTHGSVLFSAANPVSGPPCKFQSTRRGFRAMAGVPLTLLGLLLLITAAPYSLAPL
jgi:hypothetical protein